MEIFTFVLALGTVSPPTTSGAKFQQHARLRSQQITHAHHIGYILCKLVKGTSLNLQFLTVKFHFFSSPRPAQQSVKFFKLRVKGVSLIWKKQSQTLSNSLGAKLHQSKECCSYPKGTSAACRYKVTSTMETVFLIEILCIESAKLFGSLPILTSKSTAVDLPSFLY